MKKIIVGIVTFLVVGIGFNVPNALAQSASDWARSSDTFSLETEEGQWSFNVKFSAHNNPSLDEYIKGKELVVEVLNNLLTSGFSPNFVDSTLEVKISPRRMAGGEVFRVGMNLYVAATASYETVENVMFSYFSRHVQKIVNGITYFGHNRASLEDLDEGIAKVEGVLKRFADNGLILKLPSGLEIGIAPRAMSGGEVIVHDSILYVSITAPNESIERYFTRYIEGK